MSFLRKNSILLGISLASTMAIAVGCSQDEDEAASASSEIIQSQDLVIAQVYGAGGNRGAVFSHDFIEIFNKGKADVELGGKVLQYASSAGDFSAAKNIVKLPAGVLKPGHYFVVQMAQAETNPEGLALPKVDYVTTADTERANLAVSKGKIALTLEANALDACGKPATECDAAKVAALIDFVGYGGANQYEGNSAGAPTKATIARRAGGCADTGDNSSDFDTVVEPAPHTTPTDCDAVDASVPPPTPFDAGPPRDGGANEGGTARPDSGTARPDGGRDGGRDAGRRDAGATASPDDDKDDPSGEEGDDDDDAVGTSSGDVRKSGKKAATVTPPAVSPTQFGATQPDACSTSAAPHAPTFGFAGLFGIALAAATLRRRRR